MRKRRTIVLATPTRPGSVSGNATTTARWATILRALGHRVRITETWDGHDCDVLIALHARRSARSAERFHGRFPDRPLIIALTGTDLYREIHRVARARRVLGLATRLVLLQPSGVHELPAHLRPRARVIFQSATPPATRIAPRRDVFEVLVLANLRAVKDPLRTAMAVRGVPASSHLTVTHAGAIVEPSFMDRVAREETCNPRYRWLGPVPPGRTRRLLTRARVLCLTSRLEGGANVISEALAARTAILTTDIPGSTGILGEDYAGCFPVGDTKALRALLLRLESDRDFLHLLRRQCAQRAPLVHPARESAAWRDLLGELA